MTNAFAVSKGWRVLRLTNMLWLVTRYGAYLGACTSPAGAVRKLEALATAHALIEGDL